MYSDDELEFCARNDVVWGTWKHVIWVSSFRFRNLVRRCYDRIKRKPVAKPTDKSNVTATSIRNKTIDANTPRLYSRYLGEGRYELTDTPPLIIIPKAKIVTLVVKNL